MSATRANTPLKLHLLPELSRHLPRRAEALGQTLSGMVALLVWNDHTRPNLTLVATPHSRKLARVPIPCTLRAPIRRIARARARAQKLSVNAYIEALINADHTTPTNHFVIFSFQ